MSRPFAPVAKPFLATVLAFLSLGSAAQGVVHNYALTSQIQLQEPELAAPVSLWAAGPVQLAVAGFSSGHGLSLQAGQQWFARVGVGRSLQSDVLSVGGGYQFLGGQALSMHVTRQLGQERLGLAVRYDWSRSYLRLAYESQLRPLGGTDTLRFSAGLRF